MITGFLFISMHGVCLLTHWEVLSALIDGPIFVASFFAINFVSTFGVLSKNANQNNGDTDSDKRHQHITLDLLLRDEELINAFMHHLSKEYVSIYTQICAIFRKNDVQTYVNCIDK